ncbi:phage tail protein, partial [Phascolarctobacterium succinatutens]|uniref:phage tail protein n=1 Tax=Phascolarctobacterium succinatutens TaxID=626940 RepID=UPI0023F071CD
MSDFQGLPKTKNLNLNKPGYDNVADIMALNENADIIDAAIKTNIDDIANIKKGYVKTVNGVGVDSKGNVNVKEYTHPNSGVTAGSYRKVTVDALGHVTAGENPILAISEGGTGADNVSSARANLGIDTTYFNPTGSIIAFAGNALPAGYLLCDGSKVSRTTYKKLFDVIGTTYGAGDGTTTFTLPNLIDRFLEGSSAAGK